MSVSFVFLNLLSFFNFYLRKVLADVNYGFYKIDSVCYNKKWLYDDSGASAREARQRSTMGKKNW